LCRAGRSTLQEIRSNFGSVEGLRFQNLDAENRKVLRSERCNDFSNTL
jgi:hypothetical protein